MLSSNKYIWGRGKHSKALKGYLYSEQFTMHSLGGKLLAFLFSFLMVFYIISQKREDSFVNFKYGS